MSIKTDLNMKLNTWNTGKTDRTFAVWGWRVSGDEGFLRQGTVRGAQQSAIAAGTAAMRNLRQKPSYLPS